MSIDDTVARFQDESTNKDRFMAATKRVLLEEIVNTRLCALHDRLNPLRQVTDEQGHEYLDPGQRGVLVAAAEEAERISGVFPGVATKALYVAGLAWRMCGEWEHAARAWKAVHKRKPGFVDALMELTWCYGELGRHEDALAAAGRAVELDPHQPGALANMGQVLLVLGKLDEAAAWIDRSLQIAPENPITLRLRAMLEGKPFVLEIASALGKVSIDWGAPNGRRVREPWQPVPAPR